MFSGKIWAIIGILALIGGLIAFSTIQTVDLHSVTDKLASARDSIYKDLLPHVDRLQSDSIRQKNQYLAEQNLRQQKEIEAEKAKNAGQQAREQLAVKDEQNFVTVQSMSAAMKKKEADLAATRQRLKIQTTANDSLNNGAVVTMDQRIAERDTVIKKQAVTIGTLSAENTTLKGDKEGLKEELSALEKNLNKVNERTADYIEKVPKGFANINYGKRIKKAAATIRAGQVPRK